VDGTGSGSCPIVDFGISGVYAFRYFVYIFPQVPLIYIQI